MRQAPGAPIRQRGLALVEAVITLPFLLFVMLAASEITFAFVQHTIITKAVRDGARYAAEEAIGNIEELLNLTDAIKDDTKRLVVYGNRVDTAGTGTPVVSGLSEDNVFVDVVGGDNIEVRVNYPYTGILGTVLPTFGYGSDILLLFSMEATVTMRAL